MVEVLGFRFREFLFNATQKKKIRFCGFGHKKNTPTPEIFEIIRDRITRRKKAFNSQEYFARQNNKTSKKWQLFDSGSLIQLPIFCRLAQVFWCKHNTARTIKFLWLRQPQRKLRWLFEKLVNQKKGPTKFFVVLVWKRPRKKIVFGFRVRIFFSLQHGKIAS